MRDVLQALHADLHRTATPKDLEEYVPKGKTEKCEEAYRKRCEQSSSTITELQSGMRRVDLFRGQTYFSGLTRSTRGDMDYWLANFSPTLSS